MNQSKRTFIAILIVCVGISAASHAQDHENRDTAERDKSSFQPLTVELQHTVTIQGTPEEVFSLVGPGGSKLLLNTINLQTPHTTFPN